jgi:hypothetical protein
MRPPEAGALEAAPKRKVYSAAMPPPGAILSSSDGGGGGGGGGGSLKPDRGASTAETEANWLPPSGQTGDGKTSLNAKLGY